LERFLAPRVRKCLDETRIVVIQGARQVGKSTLAQLIAARSGFEMVWSNLPTTRKETEAPCAFR